jgi:hypothetical protein
MGEKPEESADLRLFSVLRNDFFNSVIIGAIHLKIGIQSFLKRKVFQWF